MDMNRKKTKKGTGNFKRRNLRPSIIGDLSLRFTSGPTEMSDPGKVLLLYAEHLLRGACRSFEYGVDGISPFHRELVRHLKKFDTELSTEAAFWEAKEKWLVVRWTRALEDIYRVIKNGQPNEKAWAVIEKLFVFELEFIKESFNPGDRLTFSFPGARDAIIKILCIDGEEITRLGGAKKASMFKIGKLLRRSDSIIKQDIKASLKDTFFSEKKMIDPEIYARFVLDHLLGFKGDTKKTAKKCVSLEKEIWREVEKTKTSPKEKPDKYGFSKLTGRHLEPISGLNFWDFDCTDNYFGVGS